MGTEKRERQKANRAAKLEQERAEEARRRRNQTIRNVVITGVALVVLFLLISALSGCSSSASDSAGQKYGDGSDTTTTTVAKDGASTTAAPAGKAAYGTGACTPAKGADEPILTFEDAPEPCIDPAKTYTATITTTEGTVVLELDTKRTPVTTNNFVNLARAGYFDGTDLFRTEAQSGIIQGGSPHTQDNSDEGPGYTIPDEGGPFSSAEYAPGAIAMANTGAPNSGSAQFFFLANEGGAYLGDQSAIGSSAGSYTVFGTTTEGLDVLEKIAALDDGTGKPSKQVTIESVEITER